MGNFFRGLALGLLGLLVWVVGSVLAAAGAIAGGTGDLFEEPLFGAILVIGFVVMVGGPLLYWVVAPVVAVVKHVRRKRA